MPTAEATYADIQATLGVVPSHIKGYPVQAIAGAWDMTKGDWVAPIRDALISPK